MYNLSCDYAGKAAEKNSEILKEANIEENPDPVVVAHQRKVEDTHCTHCTHYRLYSVKVEDEFKRIQILRTHQIVTFLVIHREQSI